MIGESGDRKEKPLTTKDTHSTSLMAGYGARRETLLTWAKDKSLLWEAQLIAEVHANLGWIGMAPSQVYANLGCPLGGTPLKIW